MAGPKEKVDPSNPMHILCGAFTGIASTGMLLGLCPACLLRELADTLALAYELDPEGLIARLNPEVPHESHE
jgi:hypothetical protein